MPAFCRPIRLRSWDYVSGPHSQVHDYYLMDDEVLVDDDLSDLDQYAHRQWMERRFED